MRPFAGSSMTRMKALACSEKTLSMANVESELKEAEAQVAKVAAQIRATFREGVRTIETAQLYIDSMMGYCFG